MSNDSNQANHPGATLMPNVHDLLNDALEIVQIEITKIRTKVRSGRGLDSRETKVLQGYIKSLVELSKEDRERMRDMDLSDFTDDELRALAAPAAKMLASRSKQK